jgi:hypothetical protein
LMNVVLFSITLQKPKRNFFDGLRDTDTLFVPTTAERSSYLI